MQKRWIEVVQATKEGEISQKEVIKTDFEKVRTSQEKRGSTQIKYKLNGLWEESTIYNNISYSALSLSETGNMQIEGAPSLPQEGLFVAIPENARFKELHILNHELAEIDGEYLILPAPKPVHEGEEMQYIPNEEIYDSDHPFPGKLAEYIGTTYVGGIKVAHIMLYLAQYVPVEKKISILHSIDLEITFETADESTDKPLRTIKANQIFTSYILGYNNNNEKEETDNTLNHSDNYVLKDPSNQGNFVIITTDDLKKSFEIFTAVKSFTYTVKTVTKEQIIIEFPAANEYESIRAFLLYAFNQWKLPPQYVILGGNIDKIPTYMRNSTPSDHYYAALNNDILPEISVSRFPASTADEMNRLCETAAYYNRFCDEWRKDVLFTTYNRDDYNECKDRIATAIGTSFKVIKKYDGSAGKKEVINTINQGVGFVNYRGHGSNTSWQAGNGLTNNDIPNLNNGDKIPQVLSIACNNNAIDYRANSRYDCFGINWIRQQKAITFLGASRPSYTSVNHKFDEYLWDGINSKLEKAGDIFVNGTIKLYKNNPSPCSIDNIRMYLLLGDPTANYREKKVVIDKTTGYILMLDTSGSMEDAIEQVKIDAKAFVRESNPKDQFAVNEFSDDARWVYPSKGNKIATVSDDLHETKEAAAAIDKLKIRNMTNMVHAIQLSNEMIKQSTADNKAFVLLSDGWHNTSLEDPGDSLNNEPPIYVAGLGPLVSESKFKSLLKKNPNSRYFHKPDAFQMMQIFNEIRALMPEATLLSNQLEHYKGSYFQKVKSIVNDDSGKVQFTAVWSDARFKYVSENPKGYDLSVYFIDPNKKAVLKRPDISDDGYCIFNFEDARPGTWEMWVEYDLASLNKTDACGTCSAIQFNTSVQMQIIAPNIHQSGQPLTFQVEVLDEGTPVEGLQVKANIVQPLISIKNALVKYADLLKEIEPADELIKEISSEEIARLHLLRGQKINEKDILGVKSTYQTLDFNNNGMYEFTLLDTYEAGSYTIEVTVSGKNPSNGKEILMQKGHSILIS